MSQKMFVRGLSGPTARPPYRAIGYRYACCAYVFRYRRASHYTILVEMITK